MKIKYLLTFCKMTICKAKVGYGCQNNADNPRCLHRNTKEGLNGAKEIDYISTNRPLYFTAAFSGFFSSW